MRSLHPYCSRRRTLPQRCLAWLLQIQPPHHQSRRRSNTTEFWKAGAPAHHRHPRQQFEDEPTGAPSGCCCPSPPSASASSSPPRRLPRRPLRRQDQPPHHARTDRGAHGGRNHADRPLAGMVAKEKCGQCPHFWIRIGSYIGRTGPDSVCFRDFPVFTRAGMRFESHLGHSVSAGQKYFRRLVLTKLDACGFRVCKAEGVECNPVISPIARNGECGLSRGYRER